MSDTRSTGTATSHEFAPSRLASKPSGADLDFCTSQIKRAGTYLEKGRIDLAEACLKQALQRAPDHPECVAYLAICLAAGRRKYVTAEKLVQNILEINPYDATAWYARGRINLLGGRRKQAFADFAQARHVSCADAGVEAVVDQMDPRRGPVLPFLPRDHFLNIVLGRLRSSLSS